MKKEMVKITVDLDAMIQVYAILDRVRHALGEEPDFKMHATKPIWFNHLSDALNGITAAMFEPTTGLTREQIGQKINDARGKLPTSWL